MKYGDLTKFAKRHGHDQFVMLLYLYLLGTYDKWLDLELLYFNYSLHQVTGYCSVKNKPKEVNFLFI